MRRWTIVAALAASWAVADGKPAEAARGERPRTRYVSAAGVPPSAADRRRPLGSRRRPVGSLAEVERLSRPGDRIVVLRAPRAVPPLDGGIALKPRQRLVGAGPRVVAASGARPRAGATSPRITNTRAERHAGDAVVLAEGALVQNLEIVDPVRGAVYGRDVRGVRVRGNDISGHNRSCTRGLHIPPFPAPTSIPAVTVPIADGLHNGWAAIMLDADRVHGAVRVDGNHVHDADCGDGIDVRVSGTAAVNAHIGRNRLERLREGEGHDSILAIGLQTRDSGRLVAIERHNRVDDIGNGGPGLSGADSEGAFAVLSGSSRMRVEIDDFVYTNPRGVGGFSSNGMEMVVIDGNGAVAEMTIRNSSLTGPPGDVLEAATISGRGNRVSLTLDHVTAADSTGTGNTVVVPFNNGDCLVGGNAQGGNALELRIADSELTGCANNGLSVISSEDPGSSVDVRVERSRISANRNINLWLRNAGALRHLAVDVRDSALCDGATNVQVDQLGSARSGSVDLGGGTLGSPGRNDLSGRGVQAGVVGGSVSARHNWWGARTGPAPGRTVPAGRLDNQPALAAEPALSC